MNAKKLIKIILIVFAIITIIGYSFYQFRNMIIGPSIEIISPTDEGIVTNPFVEISGKTKNVYKMSINDRPILIDTDGNFSDAIVLLDGYNITTICAEDRFGREVKKIFEFVFDNPTPTSSLSEQESAPEDLLLDQTNQEHATTTDSTPEQEEGAGTTTEYADTPTNADDPTPDSPDPNQP